MHTLEQAQAPNPGESLAEYVRRLRLGLGINQKELAAKAGIHLQSIGKMERGITTKLNHKTKNGLACALGVPAEYFDAVCRGIAVEATAALKFCPDCWVPGTAPDPLWMHLRAKYCFACAAELRSHCSRCKEPILSLKHRFCPYCGRSYKSNQAANTNSLKSSCV
ncbi:MAG: helix-turn-helix domain-containing protein [Acaryochloridaceae cyanobacterium CSU_3_4]|nr:helix-turn-helix domain-containing protein [Acaryochloridaceae cyanobacterium CSU_3_4]